MLYTHHVGGPGRFTLIGSYQGALDSGPAKSFESILQQALLRKLTHKATCQKCKHFSTFSSRRSISSRDLPPLLAINASNLNDEHQEFWQDSRNKTFLTSKVQLHGQVGDALDPIGVRYELKVGGSMDVLTSTDPMLVFGCENCNEGEAIAPSIACQEYGSLSFPIMFPTHTGPVPDSELDSEYSSPWFIFNDFVVQNVSEQDVLSFPGKWKVQYASPNVRSVALMPSRRFLRSSTWNEWTARTLSI